VFARLKFVTQGRPSAVAERPVSEECLPEAPVASGPALTQGDVMTPPPADNHRVSPRIKTYQVTEVRQAMSSARRELGEEAVLIQTKRLIPPQGELKYEVTFGIAGAGPTQSAPELATRVLPTIEPAKRSDAVTEELRSIRAELVALHAIVSRNYWESNVALTSGRHSIRLRNQLVHHGVDADLASEWLIALEDSLKVETLSGDEDATAAMLAEQLSSRIRVDSSLGWDSSQAKAIMLIGPAGSGKTTALLKLALEYGIKRGRSVELWSLDPQGRELDQSTQSFTQLLGVPSRVFKLPKTLSAALEEVDLQERMILIDTKGFGCESVAADQELSVLMSGIAPIDCQLVLPAAWHPSALGRVVERFEVFQPSRLLFTMFDQASTFGALLQEPWRTRKPLSFISDGALGAGKIQAASLMSILDKVDQMTAQ